MYAGWMDEQITWKGFELAWMNFVLKTGLIEKGHIHRESTACSSRDGSVLKTFLQRAPLRCKENTIGPAGSLQKLLSGMREEGKIIHVPLAFFHIWGS